MMMIETTKMMKQAFVAQGPVPLYRSGELARSGEQAGEAIIFADFADKPASSGESAGYPGRRVPAGYPVHRDPVPRFCRGEPAGEPIIFADKISVDDLWKDFSLSELSLSETDAIAGLGLTTAGGGNSVAPPPCEVCCCALLSETPSPGGVASPLRIPGVAAAAFAALQTSAQLGAGGTEPSPGGAASNVDSVAGGLPTSDGRGGNARALGRAKHDTAEELQDADENTLVERRVPAPFPSPITMPQRCTSTLRGPHSTPPAS
eukprot:CAMPEP_0118977370 /NCGR_PEP_ID=MMETSP1173-20130426/21252_1 /TAXON_ID=1034831 /ORGANISM="Rhizochromulina marina cf, Strain CCMP1243" /LENGTH=261 /DNA_ID=CAMNT_0006927467 /DNA_START=168 /DNA_END=953 /DNA_ORIENTATION=-